MMVLKPSSYFTSPTVWVGVKLDDGIDTVILFNSLQGELNYDDPNIPRCNETRSIFIVVIKNTGFYIIFIFSNNLFRFIS